MRFQELNWFDVESYLAHDDRLMFVIGACEQHAYLSLLTDVQIPMALADAASQQTGVPVAPPLNFGCSPYFLNFPGTLSLRVSTLAAVMADLVRSAYTGGFRRILVLNGHGGNTVARDTLYELAVELPEVQLRWYSWWLSHSVEAIAQKYEIKPAHANWLEAFPFVRVADLPDVAKVPVRLPGPLNAAQARDLLGDGSYGGAYQVAPQIMSEIFDACAADIVQLLSFE